MKQEYSVSEIVRNGIALLYTKIVWKRARLIRLPFYCRGKRYLSYKEGLTTGYACRFETYYMKESDTHGKIEIGKNCKFGDRVHLTACASINVGNDCLFASNILVTDNEHGFYRGEIQSYPDEIPDERSIRIDKVVIGNKVWIGENVVILPGTNIGDGCIVGANSVLKGNFEKNSIIVGTPGKIKKFWSDSEQQWINKK